MVGLGRAGLTATCGPTNTPELTWWAQSPVWDGPGGLPTSRASAAAAQGLLPKKHSLSVCCDVVTQHRGKCPARSKVEIQHELPEEAGATHVCWPNLGSKIRALLLRSRK